MDFHPYSELFPLLEGEEFTRLVEDIKANGLHHPIMVHENKILDGRNRWRACEEAGIEPNLAYLDGDRDPIKYVVSENVHRRNMTQSQLAWVAAQVATLRHGANQHKRGSAALPILPGDSSSPTHNGAPTPSQSEAAKLLGVSVRTVGAAARVREHGTEEEKKAVASGKKSAGRIANNIAKRHKKEAERANKKPSETERQYFFKLEKLKDWLAILDVASNGDHLQIPLAMPNDIVKEIIGKVEECRKHLSHLNKRIREVYEND